MNVAILLDAVSKRFTDVKVVQGDGCLELVIKHKKGRTVAEFKADDSERMIELARTYGVTV